LSNSTPTLILGHVHNQSPDAHTGTCHGAKTSYTPPTLVANPGSGPPPNACLHTPLTTVEAEGQGSDSAKPTPNPPRQKAYPTGKKHRGREQRPPGRHSTHDYGRHLKRAPISSTLYTGSYTTANLPNATSTPRRMNVLYVSAPTHAPTLRGIAMPIRIFLLVTTTRHASSYTLQSASLPKEAGCSMGRRTSA